MQLTVVEFELSSIKYLLQVKKKFEKIMNSRDGAAKSNETR